MIKPTKNTSMKRSSFTLFTFVAFTCNSIIFGGLADPCLESSSFAQTTNDNDAFPVASGVFTRPLERAKAALANEDYATAIEQLEILLGLADTGPFEFEDYLVFPKTGNKKNSTNDSVRQQAVRLIGQMPARGRNLFELKHGIRARKLLLEAVRQNDDSKVQEVSRRYFHTQAGYAATFLLGQTKLFEGDFALSNRLFRRLIEFDAARNSLDPELSIWATIALACDQRISEAVELIQSLKKKHPILTFELGDKKESFTISDVESTNSFVHRLAAQYQFGHFKDKQIRRSEWLSFRDAASRNRAMDEFPLPIPEWSVPIDGKNSDELLERLESKRLERRLPAVPALHAVAFKGCVVMRTGKGVQAIDVRSGKRVWQYPWEEAAQTGSGFAYESELAANLWTHHASGTLTSDGERVYFVESSLSAGAPSRVDRPLGSTPMYSGSNTLVALKVVDKKGVAVEGQLAWRIDAGKTTDGDLKDAVFLGPPLVYDNLAYVLIERAGQIRLVALRSDNGKTVWTQQLASTQSRDGLEDRVFRYRMSATPFFASGLLICPTQVGGLVAVDLSTQNLKWGFRYKSINDLRNLGEGMNPRYPWYDNAMFTVNQLLCFSPVDSRSYYVLETDTGKLKNIEPKGKDLFIAGAFDNRIVVVGPHSVSLDSLAGISTAKIDLSELGTPTGLGLFADRHYYLPLSGKKIVKLDLKTQKVVSVQSTATQPGNLIFYQGRIVSQSVRTLDSYWVPSEASKMAQGLLEQTSNDPMGLLLLAQIQHQTGKTDQAIETLLQSVEQVRNPYSIQFLSTLLVARINDSKKLDWETLDKGYSYLTEPAQQRAYLLAKIESKFQAGQGNAAIDEILELVELYSGDPRTNAEWVQVDANLAMNELRLIRTRLKNAVGSLDEVERPSFVVKLQQRFDQALESESLETLQTLANVLGEIEFMDRASLQIANRISEEGNEEFSPWAQALLLRRYQNVNAEEKVGLLNKLIEFYLAKGDANRRITRIRLVDVYRRLIETLQQLERAENSEELGRLQMSIKESIAALNSKMQSSKLDGPTQIAFDPDVTLTMSTLDNSRVHYATSLQYEVQAGKLPIRISSDVNGNFDIRDENGVLLYTDSSRSPGSRHSNSNYQRTHFQVIGDILILSFGYDHIGVDLTRLPGINEDFGDREFFDRDLFERAVIWRYDAFQYAEDLGFTKYARESNSLGIVHTELVDNEGNRIGKTTNVSDRGFCILKRDSLACVDPWTGQTLWVRKNILPGSDMMGDRNNVFVFDPNNQTVDIYDPLDGTRAGRIDLPGKMVHRAIQNGSHAVGLNETEQQIILSGFQLGRDTIEQKWQREFVRGTRASLLDGNRLALLAPTGEFEILNWKTGISLQKTKLRIDVPFSSIQLLDQGTDLLLFVNKNNSHRIESKRLEFGSRPSATINVVGQVYLLDKKGIKWQGPARLDGYDFVLNQPAQAPVFFFRKRSEKDNSTEIIFLRRSDGSLISFSKPLALAEPTNSIRFHPEEKKLLFNVGFNWLVLSLSDKPRPPEPPAMTGKYSSEAKLPQEKPANPNGAPNDNNFLQEIDDFRDDQEIVRKWIKAVQSD